MNQIIAMHGWGFDQNLWKLWEKEFKVLDCLWHNCDRGYHISDEIIANWDHKQNNNYKIFIGHSLAPHIVEDKVIKKATHIIFICSFSRFIYDNRKNNNLYTAIESMKRKIGTKKESKMLIDFFYKANRSITNNQEYSLYGKISLSSKGRERLKKDLDILRDSNGLRNKINKNSRVLIIEGEKDSIVKKASSNDLFIEMREHLNKHPDHWLIDNGSHLSPALTLEVIKKVKKWIEK